MAIPIFQPTSHSARGLFSSCVVGYYTWEGYCSCSGRTGHHRTAEDYCDIDRARARAPAHRGDATLTARCVLPTAPCTASSPGVRPTLGSAHMCNILATQRDTG
ncbi:hypothetical protein J6590_028422 [Homalodisca vitripennis]|nr:hypothetical protein J6590_028422 [Homalodisca vitripennis]